jgi:hypothetical protein
MRGKEYLHEKYQDKAKKLDQKAFDKKMGEALEYENEKNNRNKGESFLYNTFYRKPMQLLNLLRPEGNKPLFKPWQKALMGVIAMTVIAFPLGVMLGVYMMGKALDEATATHEKPGWLTRLYEKMFGKEEEREVVNNEALEKVNVKDLMTEVSQDLNKVRQDIEIDRPKIRSEVQSSIDKFDEIMRSRPEIQENLDRVIETAKDIAGKDASGKQRPMDDMDLSLAQNRINNSHKKTNTRSI